MRFVKCVGPGDRPEFGPGVSSWPRVLTRAWPSIAVMQHTVSLPTDSPGFEAHRVGQEMRRRDLGLSAPGVGINDCPVSLVTR